MSTGMEDLKKPVYVGCIFWMLFLVFVGYCLALSYNNYKDWKKAKQEKIECIKDSLYNEYITDKLNGNEQTN